VLALLFGCNPQKQLTKAYDKVALDAYMPLPSNKEKLIPYLNLNFPTREKTVTKDSIITKIIESKVFDTITEVKDNEIYKYIYNTDTLVYEKIKTVETTVLDTLGNYVRNAVCNAANDSLKAYKANYTLANTKLKNVEDNLKNVSFVSKIFFSAIWNIIKFPLILLVFAFVVGNFRKQIFNFILKILRLKQ
jgi:hypothetical protein